jgi:small subunit ribosomal protein S6
MRPYEVAIILDASLDDTIIRQTTDGILDFVKSKGGTPGRVDRWGRRTFAYEMKKRTEGYYLFVDVTADPQVLSDLDRMLTLSDDVVRHRVIRLPEGYFTRREIRAPREFTPVPEAVTVPDDEAAAEVATPGVALPDAEPTLEVDEAPVVTA